ncbi:MAG: hypothetical protein PHR35_11665, partial [Kiritimatiellae bacterium]|nr:hypothetical protein [Kiritimatiellia bacterium]
NIQTGVASESWRARAGEPDAASKGQVRDVVKQAIASENSAVAQTFGAIFGQMRVPMALRHIMPVGVMGVFCALCIFLMISTDTTYIHSWGSILIQDIVVPLRGGRPLTPRRQLQLLRLAMVGVALFSFVFSFWFSQIDFIMMFFMITGALWAGAGVVITCGLYWRRGTTAGAFASLVSGAAVALSGFVAQKTWVPHIYPWLESHGYLPAVKRIVEGASKPFEPFILWRVTPDAFPINSQELSFLILIISVSLYVGISLLTCRQAFNLERMLHRGKYTRPGDRVFVRAPLTFRNALSKLVGIDSEYTRGDRALAWSVFIYSVGWGFGSFLVLIVWNMISPWPNLWWAHWFKLTYLIIAGIIAAVSTVWFTIGGTWDLRLLFKRLAAKDRVVDDLDDGRVIGHVSADDVEMVEKIEHTGEEK